MTKRGPKSEALVYSLPISFKATIGAAVQPFQVLWTRYCCLCMFCLNNNNNNTTMVYAFLYLKLITFTKGLPPFPLFGTGGGEPKPVMAGRRTIIVVASSYTHNSKTQQDCLVLLSLIYVWSIFQHVCQCGNNGPWLFCQEVCLPVLFVMLKPEHPQKTKRATCHFQPGLALAFILSSI